MELNSQTYYFKDLIEIRDNNLDLKSKKKNGKTKAPEPILTQIYIIPYSILDKNELIKSPSYFYYHFDNNTFIIYFLNNQGILKKLTYNHIIEYDLYKSHEKPFIYTLIIIIILYIQKIE